MDINDKAEYRYDENGIKFLITELWDPERRDWVLDVGSFYEYDEHLNLYQRLEYNWSQEESDWMLSYKNTYYYTLRNVAAISDPYLLTLNIYPNP